MCNWPAYMANHWTDDCPIWSPKLARIFSNELDFSLAFWVATWETCLGSLGILATFE